MKTVAITYSCDQCAKGIDPLSLSMVTVITKSSNDHGHVEQVEQHYCDGRCLWLAARDSAKLWQWEAA